MIRTRYVLTRSKWTIAAACRNGVECVECRRPLSRRRLIKVRPRSITAACVEPIYVHGSLPSTPTVPADTMLPPIRPVVDQVSPPPARKGFKSVKLLSPQWRTFSAVNVVLKKWGSNLFMYAPGPWGYQPSLQPYPRPLRRNGRIKVIDARVASYARCSQRAHTRSSGAGVRAIAKCPNIRPNRRLILPVSDQTSVRPTPTASFPGCRLGP